jgi:hypothetical protein
LDVGLEAVCNDGNDDLAEHLLGGEGTNCKDDDAAGAVGDIVAEDIGVVLYLLLHLAEWID